MHDHIITVGAGQRGAGVMPAGFILEQGLVDLAGTAVIAAVRSGICHMVRNNVSDDLDAFLVSGIAQRLQLCFDTEPVVAVGDTEVDRLIKMPPDVALGRVVRVVVLRGLDTGRLNGSIACRLDIVQICEDRVVRPAHTVECVAALYRCGRLGVLRRGADTHIGADAHHGNTRNDEAQCQDQTEYLLYDFLLLERIVRSGSLRFPKHGGNAVLYIVILLF